MFSGSVVKDNPLIPVKAVHETGEIVRGCQCLESSRAVRVCAVSDFWRTSGRLGTGFSNMVSVMRECPVRESD